MLEFKSFGFDGGYDWIKAVSGAEDYQRVKFPAVHKEIEKDNLGFGSPTQFSSGHLEIEYEGIPYYLGKKAEDYGLVDGGSRDFDDDKFREPYEIAKFLSSVVLLAQREVEQSDELDERDLEEIEIDTLITGLSIMTYDEYRDEIEKVYKDEFHYKLPGDNRERIIKVNNVSVMPQGIAAFWNQTRNFEGGKIKDIDIPEVYGVIDIGGRTTDCSIFQGTNYMRGTSFYIFQGAHDVYRNISRDIDVPENKIESAYIEGRESFTYDSKNHNISEIMKREFNSLANKIYKQIKTKWDKELRGIEKIYLSGGGAIDTQTILEDRFSHEVKSLTNPQYGNALGYYKLGMYHVNVKNKKSKKKKTKTKTKTKTKKTG